MQHDSRIAWLLVLAYVVVAAFTVLDYGVTWDEQIQSLYGDMVIDYYGSGFRDRSYESFLNVAYYGPFFEVFPALAYRAVGAWRYEIRHVATALFAALGLIAVLKIAERIAPDRRVAAFAVLALLTMPAYYGHTFFNSKDIPFATLFAWAMYAMLRLADKQNWQTMTLLGVTGGLAFATRIGGVLIFAVTAVAFLLASLLQPSQRGRFVSLLKWLTGAAVIAWVVMTLLWPWAHTNPIGNPIEALSALTSFGPRVEVLFEGRTWSNIDLPRRYLLKMIAITTPLPALMLIAAGLAVTVRRIWKRDVPLAQLMVVLWAVLPPLVQAVFDSPIYDGTRHFLFIYPAFALLAALGAMAIIETVRHWSAAPLLGASLLSAVPTMVQLHPYQYAYFNAAVGGTAAAVDRYDTDYWASSYREAALWVRDHACRGRTTTVVVAGDRWSLPAVSNYLPAGFSVHVSRDERLPPPPPMFDYYIAFRRYRSDLQYADRPIVHRVERMGATFSVVRGGCR